MLQYATVLSIKMMSLVHVCLVISHTLWNQTAYISYDTGVVDL